MAATTDLAAWFTLRLIVGVASALVFVIAVSTMLSRLRGHAPQLIGWGFGGVGAGIALSGAIVLIYRPDRTWRTAWVVGGPRGHPDRCRLAVAARAGCRARRGAARPPGRPRAPPGVRRATDQLHARGCRLHHRRDVPRRRDQRELAGLGRQQRVGARRAGRGARAGDLGAAQYALGAAHACWPRLLLQAGGIALPALAAGVGPALVSAVLFGGTFLGVASIALAHGAHLRFPRAVAILTTGYGVGQIAGPLVVTPLVADGYHVALLVGAAIVLAAAPAAAVLRINFPHRVGGMVEPSRAPNRARV